MTELSARSLYHAAMVVDARLEELDRERTAIRQQMKLLAAKLEGVEAEMTALRRRKDAVTTVVAARRTDAIIAILREADGSLPPKEITARLRQAGRDDGSNAVTATLTHLVAQGQVIRVEPGLYRANHH